MRVASKIDGDTDRLLHTDEAFEMVQEAFGPLWFLMQEKEEILDNEASLIETDNWLDTDPPTSWTTITTTTSYTYTTTTTSGYTTITVVNTYYRYQNT